MVELPVEILDAIFGCVDDEDSPQVFSSVSLVSRTFHQIILPHKFKSLILTQCHRKSRPDCQPKLIRALIAKDEHAVSVVPLVQTCRLYQWGEYRTACASTHLTCHNLISLLLSFSNLVTLVLEECQLTSLVFRFLGELVQIQSLKLDRCAADTMLATESSNNLLSKLTNLHTIEYKQLTPRASEIILRALVIACIPTERLRVVNIDSWPVSEFTRYIIETVPPLQIRELSLNTRLEDQESVWEYLTKATSLTHLTIPDLNHEVTNASLLPSFPQLRNLCIDLALTRLFSNQPMKELEIVTHNIDYQLLTEHLDGVVFPQVEKLGINHRLGAYRHDLPPFPVERLQRTFPKLKVLTVVATFVLGRRRLCVSARSCFA